MADDALQQPVLQNIFLQLLFDVFSHWLTIISALIEIISAADALIRAALNRLQHVPHGEKSRLILSIWISLSYSLQVLQLPVACELSCNKVWHLFTVP